MNIYAMQWTWSNECGEGVTESAVWAAIGVFLVPLLVLWVTERWLSK